jgi:hypothetical protein
MASRVMQNKLLDSGKKFDENSIAKWIQELPEETEAIKAQLKANKELAFTQKRENKAKY